MSKKNFRRDLEVSSIGAWLYGDESCLWKTSDNRSEESSCKAVDLDIQCLDTAEVYGTAEYPHHNETLLGEILKPCIEIRLKLLLKVVCILTKIQQL